MIPITCNAVGDILALATLFLDIARALDEARGAPAKYRAFNGELKSLHIVLASVGRVAELTTDALLRDEIVREVDRCGKDVRRALERVAKFSALGSDGSADDVLRVRMKRQWYKLEWRLGWHGGVEDIREELAAATQRLTSYLVISNADGIQNLGVSITSQFDAMTARICTMMMEQFTLVAERDAGLSRTVRSNAAVLGQLASQGVPPILPGTGLDSNKAAAAALLCYAICTMHDSSRTTHTALLLAAFSILMLGLARDGRRLLSDVTYTRSNSITLDDAMGRRLVLPLQLCETRELFHATLVNLFARTDGRWFINERRYELKLKRGTHDIDDWDIRPDTEVEMAVMVQYASSSLCVQCPVCLIEVGINFALAPTCICARCGRELKVRLELFGIRPGAQETLKRFEYAANDCGPFPRARPNSMFGTQCKTRTQPRDPHVNPPASSEPLSDTDNRPELRLSWRDQVDVFTRFHITHSARHPIINIPAILTDPRGLHLAAENDHYALLKAGLLDRDAAVHAFVAGYTELHLASLMGHTRVVELLLDHGAAIDAATEDGITPLACAVSSHRLETVALLLARGAMVDASESMRAAVLYAAAYANNVGVVQMLLRLGLHVDVLFRGETALGVAVRSKNRESIEVLLQNGADVNMREGAGETLLSIAALIGSVEIFEQLRVSGRVVDYALPSAPGKDMGRLLCREICCGSDAIAATIIQHTAATDLDARFENGATPLSLTSTRGNVELVERLLSQGADPNVEALPLSYLGKQGSWKPLHAAAHSGHVKVVEILLRHDVDVNARTETGDTPILLALEGKREALADRRDWAITRYDEVLEILLSRGAVIDERSSLLLEEITRLDGSWNSHSELVVPGAWREDVEQDQNSDTDSEAASD